MNIDLDNFFQRKSQSYYFNTHTHFLNIPGKPQLNRKETYNFGHELVHVCMHNGTPYGLFLESMSVRWTILIRRLLRETDVGKIVHAEHGLLQWFEGMPDDEIWNDAAQRLIPWISLQRLRSILEADDLQFKNTHEDSCFNFLVAIEENLDDADKCTEAFNKSCLEFFLNKNKSTERSSDCVQHSKEDFGVIGIGGLAVNEALAVLLPGMIGSNDIFNMTDFTYSIFFRQYQRMLGSAFNLPEPQRIHAIKNYISILSKFSDHPREIDRRIVCAICELALFTPIGFPFRNLRKGRKAFSDNNLKWKSISPGGRALLAFSIVLQNLDLIEIGVQSSRDFQDKICEKLGWPKIKEFGLNHECNHMIHSVSRARSVYSKFFERHYAGELNFTSAYLMSDILGDQPYDGNTPNMSHLAPIIWTKRGLDALAKDKNSRIQAVVSSQERLLHALYLLSNRSSIHRANPFPSIPLREKISISQAAGGILRQVRPELTQLLAIKKYV